jgi:hypothetical protein
MELNAIPVAVLFSLVVSAQPATVRVAGPRSLTVSTADLAAMPRTHVTTTVRDQQSTYEGVSIRELLTRVGVPAGEALRGRDLASAVVVTGADGYQAAFGIAEFDPAYTDRVAILADRKDGNPLAGNEAPFQLVLSGEKRPARWVRQVVSIEVRTLAATSK